MTTIARRLLIGLALLFCFSELAARVFFPVSLVREESSPRMYEAHPRLGFQMRPGLTTKVRAWDGKKPLYDVTYRSDDKGRRLVEIPSLPERNKHLLLLGGSTVFGMGLHDNETLAFFLGQNTKQYRPFNYARDGYGPQGAYAQAEIGALSDSEIAPEGVTVFFFQMRNEAGGHVQTLHGSFELLITGWGENLCFYDLKNKALESNETPKFLGRLQEFAPLRMQLFRFFQNFQILNLLYPKLFGLPTDNIRATAWFLKNLKLQVESAQPKTRFVVAIHPLSDRRESRKIVDLLLNTGVEVLDYSTMIPENEIAANTAFRRYFSHPNALLNSKIATRLIEDLKLD